MTYTVTTQCPTADPTTVTAPTLADALQFAHDEAVLRFADDSAADALSLTAAGGTVGPLPDGTVIEVRPA